MMSHSVITPVTARTHTPHPIPHCWLNDMPGLMQRQQPEAGHKLMLGSDHPQLSSMLNSCAPTALRLSCATMHQAWTEFVHMYVCMHHSHSAQRHEAKTTLVSHPPTSVPIQCISICNATPRLTEPALLSAPQGAASTQQWPTLLDTVHRPGDNTTGTPPL